MWFKRLYSGFETRKTPAPKVLAAKHIPNPDFGAILKKKSRDVIISHLLARPTGSHVAARSQNAETDLVFESGAR